MVGCPNCGFTHDPETGAIYDVTYPCPECGLGGAIVARDTYTQNERVASRFLQSTGYFQVGDYIWLGKYKNKLGQIISFQADEKGNPTVTVRPVPQGRKQDKTFSLFKIWKVQPEQLAELKAKGKLGD